VELPDTHWHSDSIRDIILALAAVLMEDGQARLRLARFLALSLDEATARDCTPYLSSHMYLLDDNWTIHMKIRSQYFCHTE
jgi:hypothetical protein